MKNFWEKTLIGISILFFSSQLNGQNIGVSGSFSPSTVEVCQSSDLTIFVSNEDFVNALSAGDAMITVTFPLSAEFSTPINPPSGTNPSIFSWTVMDNVWTGMLAGDIPPLSNVDIVFDVTALIITSGTSVDLEVTLTNSIDLNEVNNTANPSLEIIPNTSTPIDECPIFDQGTYSCLDQVPLPALTIPDFVALFGNSVFDPAFCEDFDITFSDDTTNMNSGCAADPIYLTRTYSFEYGMETETCVVQYTIIDDLSPEVTCQDVTVELDENGMLIIDPEILNDGITHSCNGAGDDMISFSVSQSSFDCADLDPNEMNCASTYGVKLYAEDACGNIDSCDANITIIDNTPPVIDCPVDLTINLASGECTLQHFFTIPTATDNCDAFNVFNGTTTINQISGTNLTSGDIFIPGIYTWTYEAMDACGNVSQCNFSLEVIEFPIDDYIISLACNDLVNISLNDECFFELQADMILEGGPYRCYEEYEIEIEGIVGTIITATGQYTVTITDPETGNNCWSTINVEDKLPPVLDCNYPFCEAENLNGAWDAQSENFEPDPACWNFDLGVPVGSANYDIIEIRVQVGGIYSFTMTDDPNFNGIAALYSDIFDPVDNCLNLLIGDDDLTGINESEPQFSILLSPGTYFLVSSNWTPFFAGSYQWTYSGPATLLAGCEYKCFDFSSIINNEANIPPPNATDCSDFTIIHSDSFSGDDCTGKFITRTYVATDENGLSSSCSLTFELEPITIEDEIIAPVPFVELNCNQGTDPQDIADHFDNPSTFDNQATELIENNEGFEYAYPTYLQNGHPQKVDKDVCGIYAVYDDLNLTTCDEGCEGTRKVIRTWTIIDWCTSEIQNFKQTIKAIDKDAPTLTSNDITVSTDYWVCEASFEIPTPGNLLDNCDSSPKYDVTGPAGIDIQGSFENGFSVIAAPKGMHTFYYNAYDCCGNEENYPFTVFVHDNTPPVAVAKLDIVISLTNGTLDEDGHAKMFAESVDNGSHDACSENLKFEIRRDSDACSLTGNTTYNNDGHPFDSGNDSDEGKFVKFCCSDVNNATVDVDGDGISDPGYVKVWLRVWDDGDMDGQFGTDGDNYNESWVHVKVDNKLEPIISCPPDVTITCDMDADDLSITGMAIAIGVCGQVEVEYNDIVTNLDACDEGNIRRRWRVVGNSQIFCDQNIIVENENLSTPIVSFSQVGDFTAIGCPDMIDAGEPTWQAGVCDMMAYTVKTDTFKIEDGACFKLLREYTVINWCDYDPTNPQWVETSDFTDGIVTHLQVIKVTDETKPELSMCENQMFEINDHSDSDNDGNLCEAKITLSNTATDPGSEHCPTGWLKWQVIVDLWSDGIDDLEYNSQLPLFDSNFNDTNGNGIPDVYIAPTLSGEQIDINLPDIEGSMSNHKVRWKVSDGCNNITECSNDFMVVDKKAPTPYCISINSAIMESSGTVELWAIDFDLGSFDNCTLGEDLRFTFTDTPPSNDNNYDPAKKSSKKIFNCDDVLNSPVEVEMYVWDEKGNSDFCYVFLSLIDNSNVCGEGKNISGNIATESGDVASNISVILNTTLPEYPRTSYTDAEGNYVFSNAPLNSDLEITANYEADYRNGVSTLDLVKIQRHILGIETLESPYKLVAADINRDYFIKTSDLIQLRKLILGITTEFADNDSWKFVDASQELDMDVDLDNVSYSRKIYNLKNNTEGMDFVAVKIGDVTDNVNYNLTNGTNPEIRSSKKLQFHFDDKNVKENDLVELNIKSQNFSNIMGYQFTAILDGLEFADVNAGNVPMTQDYIGNIDHNILTASYHSPTPISLSKDKDLFTLVFTAKKDGRISEMLHFTSLITSSEAYTLSENGKIETLDLILEENRTSENNLVKNHLYQNEPNPFRNNTVIGFDIESDGPVTLSIFDANGRILKTIRTQGKKGYNEINVNSNDLESRGLMIYEIKSGQFVDSKKMIVLN